MGFTLLAPKPKATAGAFRVSTVQFRKGADWRLVISMPSAEYTMHFGAAEKFDLLLGDGADIGKLMIRANSEGGFKPTMLKHCAVFRLPETDGAPQGEFKTEDPDRARAAEGTLVVTLPEWAWNPERWKAVLAARGVAQRQQNAERLTRRETSDKLGKVGGK
ncbi:hypothetical protein MRS76_20510 [Rhizobiaceae bacterium n13]|uniref:hypothetical protein n=1 Tax=Ferirhizobium litorale TaxID=2927786 RepID=UPI0024B2FB1C|nr:hypothetical protein [Fererhizobium litorale]MDI7864325.1 hypothetical protein [Fererhizobium litorale]